MGGQGNEAGNDKGFEEKIHGILYTYDEFEIIPSGISGLDKLLRGGFPRGAVILVAGNPGTGKSTFAARFIYEGLRRGEPGIYVNFVEPKRDFYAHMRSLGVDFKKYEDQGIFKYVEALTIADVDALEQQLEEVATLAINMGAKRLVVDSVTVMLQILGRDKARVRELLQNFFVNGIKPLGVTSVLIAEYPYGAQMVGEGVEEFVVDGVIILRFETRRGKPLRIMEIRKARWAPISISELPFYIRHGELINIVLPEKLEEIPPPDYSKVYSLCEFLAILMKTGLARIELPYTERRVLLEEVCPYLILTADSQIAIAVEPSMVKMFISLIPVLAHLRTKKKVLVLSLQTSSQAITQVVQNILKTVGEIKEGEDSIERIAAFSLNPSAYTPQELTILLRMAVDLVKPKVVVIEGFNLLERLQPRDEILPELFNFILWLRRRRITGVYLYNMLGLNRETVQEDPLAPLYDAIISIETPVEHLRPSKPYREVMVTIHHQLISATLRLSIDARRFVNITRIERADLKSLRDLLAEDLV
ncbi:ATPase domain-containing protein [Pyrofollis japonicus]|uniref:RAD55 family ATPase n=1 Tax=Pyrofollis japonicus TaxID=3060460 RepID=UPI00295C209D|nr:ATPase domain-containing protein [Pyrofollis japonicus]BEP17873.1 ATPase domain-containing protein [Pyrofollis japonicus]